MPGPLSRRSDNVTQGTPRPRQATSGVARGPGKILGPGSPQGSLNPVSQPRGAAAGPGKIFNDTNTNGALRPIETPAGATRGPGLIFGGTGVGSGTINRGTSGGTTTITEASFELVNSLSDLTRVTGTGTVSNTLGTYIRTNNDGRGYFGNGNNWVQVDGQTSIRVNRISDTSVNREWAEIPEYFTGGLRQ